MPASAESASGQLTPTFSCAAANGDGTFTYFFGYNLTNTQGENSDTQGGNSTGSQGGNSAGGQGGNSTGGQGVTVPIGSRNQFSPGPKNQGQPTAFSPGSHRSVFSVTTSGSTLSWHLDEATVTASSRSLCSNVPVLGEAPTALVLPLATVAPLGVWFVLARRRARRRSHATA